MPALKRSRWRLRCRFVVLGVPKNRKGYVMTIRSLILASAIVAAGSGFAFAQYSSPPAQTGGDMNATPSQTERSTGETRHTNGVATRRPMTVRPETTGSGGDIPTPGSNAKETQEKNASPASPDEGLEKQK